MSALRSIPVPIRLALALWLLAATLVGASGLLQRLPFPGPQMIVLGLTLALVVASLVVPVLRDYLRAVDPRTLVSLHLTRFVGIYFLILHAQGRLPGEFAVTAGWGDIAAATGAALLLLTPLWRTPALWVWNLYGLLDLGLVVFTAARLGRELPQSMAELLHLPLSLLPTFLVPILLASHVAMLLRSASQPR